MPLVTSGVDHGNLRELCLERMQELDLQCRDGAYIVSLFVLIQYSSYSRGGYETNPSAHQPEPN